MIRYDHRKEADISSSRNDTADNIDTPVVDSPVENSDAHAAEIAQEVEALVKLTSAHTNQPAEQPESEQPQSEEAESGTVPG